MTNIITSLWDFNSPEMSEQRFLAAMYGSSPDEVIILQTQVARTHGIRQDFARAREILAGLEAQIQGAGLETQVYYYLELGRTYSSATHPPESQTDEARELARAAYLRASEIARAAKLDNLAIDALHMLAFVDTAPTEQVAWNRKALAILELSDQPDAKKWEGSLRNNTGYALYQLGRYEDALEEFKLALDAYQRRGDPQTIRIALWMIAWNLRALERLDEALEIQLRLAKECDEAREPDAYVFEELELLYRALKNDEKAEFYAARRRAVM